MSARRSGVEVTRLVGMGVALVVVIVAAVYVVVDLARWEWNRAVLSALICIAGLVVFSSALIVGHLTRLERWLERPRQQHVISGSSTSSASSVEPTGVPTRPRFMWLETPERDRGVFVPVLLGAGVVLSFVAYLVERTAALMSSGGIDVTTQQRLAADLPLGDGAVQVTRCPPRRTRSRWSRVVAGVLGLLMVGVVVEGLRELTQTRPDEVIGVGVTTVEVVVQQRRILQPVEVVVLDLWGACRSRLGAGVSIRSLDVLGDELVRLEIDRALGETGRRRLIGCFEDHTLDLVRADVVALRVSTAGDP